MEKSLKMIWIFFRFSFLALILMGCGRNSVEDFYDEGQHVIASIIIELKDIETRQELIQSTPRLKKLFNDLVTIMIAARDYMEQHHSIYVDTIQPDHLKSDQLREELNRIYLIEGAREVIEKCQEEALIRMDAYEKRKKGP